MTKHGVGTARIQPRLRASGTLSLYEAAKAGLGIADLPGYLVEDDLRARRLVCVLEAFETTPRGVFVIYPAGPLIPVRAREAAAHLIRELKQQLG